MPCPPTPVARDDRAALALRRAAAETRCYAATDADALAVRMERAAAAGIRRRRRLRARCQRHHAAPARRPAPASGPTASAHCSKAKASPSAGDGYNSGANGQHDASGDHRSRRRRVEPGVRRLEGHARSAPRWAASACSSTTSAGSATAAGARTSRRSMRWPSTGRSRRAGAALRVAGPRASRQRRRGAGSAGARTRAVHASVQPRLEARRAAAGRLRLPARRPRRRHARRPRPTARAGPARGCTKATDSAGRSKPRASSDYADNPLSFSHAYWLIEPTFAPHGVTYRARLGTPGRQRRACTADAAGDAARVQWLGRQVHRHAAGRPRGSLRRRRRQVRRDAKPTSSTGCWHGTTSAPTRGGRYGSEWDASLGFPVHGPVTGLVKLADYRSDGFARDTRKLWLQLEWAGKR